MLNLNEKMQLLNIKRRPKRGIINGLGSIIKSITRNVSNSERKLTHKINTIVKINNNITTQFNNKIKNINKNNIIINKKLDNLAKSLSKIINDINIIKIQN